MTTVVKLGGSLLDDEEATGRILKDFSRVYKNGELMVLVHGGGKEVTRIAEMLGVKQKFVVSPSGIRSRYTDKTTIEIFTMVMTGKINSELVAKLQSLGINAVGLSGLDGRLLLAERKKRLIIIDERGRKRVVDGGYTGRVVRVNDELLTTLIKSGYVPVVSPVALGLEGELLNVDGDRAAAYIAGAIKADRVIFLTNVPGLLDEKRSLIKELSLEKARAYIKRVGAGMDKKLLASAEALELGVKEAIISSGVVEAPIRHAIDSGEKTVVRRVGSGAP